VLFVCASFALHFNTALTVSVSQARVQFDDLRRTSACINDIAYNPGV